MSAPFDGDALIRRALESAPDAMVIVDKAGTIVLVNTQTEKLFGYAREELLGQPVEILMPARFHRDHLTHRDGFGAAPQAREFGAQQSLSGVRKNGEEFPVEIRLNPLEVEREMFVSSSIRDITSRKRLETDLAGKNAALARLEKDRGQQYLDAAEVMLVALDAEGRITLVNRYACSVLGWTADELLGRDWIATCLPERIRGACRALLSQLIAGVLPANENPILTKLGEERLIEWRNTLLRDDTGRVTGSLSSGADITDRRLLEKQYQQAQKMEAIGRLAGSVAHDFNNLLTVILGNCELLLPEITSQDPRRHDVVEIQKAGTSAAALTQQLLAFSRKEITEPTVFDLNDAIGHMRAMLERLIGDDVTVRLELDPRPAAIKADRGHITQIVMNLAVNARDAMPQGGTLTIATASVQLPARHITPHCALEPGPYVALSVSDTGTGMTPEVQARLFEPFFTTKGPGKGTGLGLATVHGIVAQSGGSVSVSSVVGKGTSFAVYFPKVNAVGIAVGAAPTVRPPRTGTQNVLVVDDAEGVCTLAKRLLERQGYTVLIALNADEAIRLCDQQTCVDLLLTDVVMPGASGPELAKRLTERWPALKVIYMSGYTAETIALHGVVDDDVAFLHKPFSSETLGRTIRDAFDRA